MRLNRNSISIVVKRFTHILAGAVLGLISSTANAALLGVQPGFPQAVYDNTGTTTFSNMNLVVDAGLVDFKFTINDTPYFIFGDFDIHALIDASCSVAGNEPLPEIRLSGDIYDPNFTPVLSGELLTGEIVAAGFSGGSNTNITSIDFRFTSAGGLLVSGGYWPAGKDIGVILTVENSNFVDCLQPFSGKAKGYVGPIDPLPPTGAGTGTQGYWKNHLSAWPLASITVGGQTYTASVANNLMKHPTKGDKTWNMFQQLTAAILNVANGTDSSCISDVIAAGNAWLAANPPGSGVKANSDPWANPGDDIHSTLDAYNNGHLCAPHRVD